MNPKIPQTDAEADALRAYIPTETLLALAKIRDEEIRESDRRRIEYEENRAIYEAAKAAEKKGKYPVTAGSLQRAASCGIGGASVARIL